MKPAHLRFAPPGKTWEALYRDLSAAVVTAVQHVEATSALVSVPCGATIFRGLPFKRPVPLALALPCTVATTATPSLTLVFLVLPYHLQSRLG